MSFLCLLPVILFVGLLTSLTDLRSKKIYNQHLTIGSFLSIAAVAYVAVFKQEDIFFHAANGIAACLIGFLLYRSDLWKGGDAKLFMLYAFVMPTPYYNPVPISSAVSLFVCSFLVGLIILSPVFIKDILINYKGIAHHLFSIQKRYALFQASMQMFAYSWIIYPFYHLLQINNPFVILTVSYLIFNGNYYLKEAFDIDKHYMLKFFKKASLKLIVCVILGVLLRLWVLPDSLSGPALRNYCIMIVFSSVTSVCIKTTLDFLKDYQQRIAFAPILFTGCVLSYTPFLKEAMQIVVRWKMLFYSVL